MQTVDNDCCIGCPAYAICSWCMCKPGVRGVSERCQRGIRGVSEGYPRGARRVSEGCQRYQKGVRQVSEGCQRGVRGVSAHLSSTICDAVAGKIQRSQKLVLLQGFRYLQHQSMAPFVQAMNNLCFLLQLTVLRTLSASPAMTCAWYGLLLIMHAMC